jgi:hypothetical protein
MLSSHHDVAHESRPRKQAARTRVQIWVKCNGSLSVEPDSRSIVVATYSQPLLGLGGFPFLNNRCSIRVNRDRNAVSVRRPLSSLNRPNCRHGGISQRGRPRPRALPILSRIAAVDFVGLKIAKGGAQDRRAHVSARRVSRHIADRVLAFGGRPFSMSISMDGP